MAETVEQIREWHARTRRPIYLGNGELMLFIGTLIAEIDRLEERLKQYETQGQTDEELWQQGERYTRRLDRSEAVCKAYGKAKAWPLSSVAAMQAHGELSERYREWLAGEETQ